MLVRMLDALRGMLAGQPLVLLFLAIGAGFLVGVVLVVLDPPAIQDDATTTFEIPRAPHVPAPEPGPVPQRI